MNEYFRVVADPATPDRWFLGEPLTVRQEQIDAREFTQGKCHNGKIPAIVPVMQEGPPVAFNFAAFDMPVIAESIVNSIATIAGPHCIQTFPVTIGKDAVRGFEILNVTCVKKCIDEQRSKITKWRTEDGRPDKVGQYRMITDLSINADSLDDAHVFRIQGWEVALIISDWIKAELEKLDALGVNVIRVS